MVLEAINGHENIVELVQVIPEGIVKTPDDNKEIKVEYALAVGGLKGGELYYNFKKYGVSEFHI